MVCLLVSAAEFQGVRTKRSFGDREAFVTPGERRPGRIKEDAISRPADPLPWWDEVRGKSAWESALRGPGNERIVHGRQKQPCKTA